jgi:hypothetical protein
VAIAAGILVSGAAANSPANGVVRGGQQPVQSGVLHPITAAYAAPASPFALLPAVASRPASVGPAAYSREKQAALTAQAPMGAGVVDVPQSPRVPFVSTNFAGLNRLTAQNHGFIFVPPDTTIAKSPNRVLEGTNSALRLFTPAGGVLATADLNTFFGALTTNGLMFDPKVIFDRLSNNRRFWIVALQKKGNLDADPTNDFSRIFFAVSRSVDPVNFSPTGWCRYSFSGIRDATTSNKSWADFPQVGVGSDAFLLATNQFKFTNNGFTFAILRAFRKLVAENNAVSCPGIPFFTFQPAGGIAGNFDVFAIQPVHANTAPSSFAGTTNPAYALSTRRGSSNRYHVWRVRNVSTSPTLGHVILAHTSYAIPPSSPQPGTLVRLDTGDNRVLGASGIGNTFEGIFTTLCNFTGGTPNESCTLAPRVVVGQTSTGLLSAAIIENPFRGFGDNIFAHHPSIALNFSIKGGSSWLRSGATFRLNSVALIKNPFAGWTGVSQYAPGFCSYTTTSRTGDYSGAQTDPTNLNTFWLGGEQATAVPGLNGCNWATRIAQLVP